MTYKEACDYANKQNKNLNAEKFSSVHWVYIIFNQGLDGTSLIRSAFIERLGDTDKDFVIVYQEHGKPIVCSNYEDEVFEFIQQC